ncbi:GNAT family N-acetyltransferase [Sphingomonas colocasiae]|uniref:GNAT family N-acetyltransferase n=1 Tax=Sphingomonas colocasiae TaxID=1848973 RepID=A0ABS7PN21_9SPHN|nr:GNAT family N-acetyltransferase [Sphingomonas colocasiae]MBY8822717.1 GNAT family N-acetyltransferase [Sphingomonas colocasiae]
MSLPLLSTARLVLRPLAESDADALHDVLSDDETMRFWSSPPHVSIDQTRDYVVGNAAQDEWLTWAITEGGPALGWVVLGEHRPGIRELGYILHRDRWGSGYAGEAVAAVVNHGFSAMGLRRIFADCDPENTGSVRLLERLGFRLEGHLRGEWETHIGVRDSLIFGLLASEWR